MFLFLLVTSALPEASAHLHNPKEDEQAEGVEEVDVPDLSVTSSVSYSLPDFLRQPLGGRRRFG